MPITASLYPVICLGCLRERCRIEPAQFFGQARIGAQIPEGREAIGEEGCRNSDGEDDGQGLTQGDGDPLVGAIADAKTAPMAALDVDRCRDVVHDLAGVAAIGLQEEGRFVRATALANRIVEEDALGAVPSVSFASSPSPVSGWL
ncbi:hypothetical protein GWK36_14205 [Caldichromatium japonicum]|uniref:Uncharacterized protein n=1 Tax=Caldichromatium japonicum TaxID=2699430 RepID=A0A6G7VG03_9GAMM|nr:hypothetical protein [Caldichromatium japonicum]QIK38951.1 hypothetical protein GWK36_14205 [Caldichromatium japonicum]